jgi:hypothetical protein
LGHLIQLASHRPCKKNQRILGPREELPLMLSRLLAAGATDFARVALDAWGRNELAPEELLELCTTYAAVAGLENA